MGTLANSEDTDERPHYASFHQGLHRLQIQNGSSKKEIHYILEIITGDPSIYKMDQPDFIICSNMENSIGLKRVKLCRHLILLHAPAHTHIYIPTKTHTGKNHNIMLATSDTGE